jgi:hypothetical protein
MDMVVIRNVESGRLVGVAGRRNLHVRMCWVTSAFDITFYFSNFSFFSLFAFQDKRRKEILINVRIHSNTRRTSGNTVNTARIEDLATLDHRAWNIDNISTRSA